MADNTAIFVFGSYLEEIWPPQIKMIYTSSWSKSWGDSESEVRNFKFHLWHIIQPYLCFCNILEKLNLHRSGWSIYHLDQIFKDIQNLKSEILNSVNSICIWHISVELIFECSRMNYAIIRDPTVRIRCWMEKGHVCVHSSRVKTFHFQKFIIGCTDETGTIYVPAILLSQWQHYRDIVRYHPWGCTSHLYICS